jgi:transposase
MLKETRWLWLKNPDNLTLHQQRRLSRIDSHSLWTAKAYRMRLALQLPMVRVAQLVESHLPGILAHWSAKVTNAFLEGLNRRCSATRHKARGYRSTRYFITLRYFTAAKLKIPPQANFPLAKPAVPR